jgi:hypothetical protein
MEDTSPQSKYMAGVERSEERIRDLGRCIEEQRSAISEACDRMFADRRAGKNVTDEIAFWQTKVKQLKGFCDALVAEKDNQTALLKQEGERLDGEILHQYRLMRGLTSYGIANGMGTPDLQLLHASLDDVLNAKTDSDRVAAKKTADLVFQYGKFGNEAKSDTAILDEYESIEDPEYSSAFYKQHEATIKAQYQLRIDAAKSTKEGK